MTKLELLRRRHQMLVDQFDPDKKPKWADLTQEDREEWGTEAKYVEFIEEILRGNIFNTVIGPYIRDLPEELYDKFGSNIRGKENIDWFEREVSRGYWVYENRKLLEEVTNEELEPFGYFEWGFSGSGVYYFSIPDDAESIEDCSGLSGCAG